MEAPLDVPVGNLIDFDTETPARAPSEPSPGDVPSGNGHVGDVAGEESDATESADSDNEAGGSPMRWGGRRRSSSAESFSSSQSTESARDEATAERRDFMRHYVEKIFSGGEDLDQEEKARFGELCSGEDGKGREWFARYVSAQRCNSKCVSEQTFYRLMQSFALVLFECHQMDDFSPAKNLMTMCFTYFYIGKSHAPPLEAKEKPAGSIDSYLRSANSWLAEKKDIAERLLKNTSARTENVKGFFGGLETKLKGPAARKSHSRAEPGGGEERGEDLPVHAPQAAAHLAQPALLERRLLRRRALRAQEALPHHQGEVVPHDAGGAGRQPALQREHHLRAAGHLHPQHAGVRPQQEALQRLPQEAGDDRQLGRRAIQAAERPHRADGHRVAARPARHSGSETAAGAVGERKGPRMDLGCSGVAHALTELPPTCMTIRQPLELRRGQPVEVGAKQPPSLPGASRVCFPSRRTQKRGFLSGKNKRAKGETNKPNLQKK
uniref:KIAA0513 n=1 Tax=Cairina moschata TaxID=8855 RepID=A0A8C3C4M7_CAIMO